MDPHPPSRGKTYSEVMNEWAAQQAFVKGSRSRLLHPPYDAHPVAKIAGYLARLLALLVVPAGVYIFLVLKWAGGPEFNTMLTKGLATTLNAGEVKTTGAAWQLRGQLAIPSLEASGAPGAPYEKLRAEAITARVPAPMFVRRQWALPRVSIGNLDLTLRSGGLGTVPVYETSGEDSSLDPFIPNTGTPSPTPAPRPQKTGAAAPAPAPAPSPLLSPPDTAAEGPVLMAGYGINPDFGALRIDSLQIGTLALKWGSTPATRGSLTGTQAEFARASGGGWTLDATGGDFQQGWLKDWKIEKTNVTASATKAVIGETRLTHTGGGTGTFSGEIILGDMPGIQGRMHLETVPLHTLMDPMFAGLSNAEVTGDLTLSGSTNRSTGIQTDGTFRIISGRFNPMHLFNALQRITGESQFISLPMKGGSFTLKTGGLEASSGVVIEVPSFEVRNSIVILSGHLRYERSRPAGIQLANRAGAEKVALTGLIKVSIPPDLAAKFSPDVAKKYLTPGDNGWSAIDIPLDGKPEVDPTFFLASDMVLMTDQAGR